MKTTVLGILAILTVAIGVITSLLKGAPVDWGSAIAGVTAGVGLIHAADAPAPPSSPSAIPGR